MMKKYISFDEILKRRDMMDSNDDFNAATDNGRYKEKAIFVDEMLVWCAIS